MRDGRNHKSLLSSGKFSIKYFIKLESQLTIINRKQLKPICEAEHPVCNLVKNDDDEL
jgi:hypothetical protein